MHVHIHVHVHVQQFLDGLEDLGLEGLSDSQLRDLHADMDADDDGEVTQL